MTGLGPTGGRPTAGSPVLAGSGDWLVSGTSSATFLNGASYASGVLFSTGGSGASFVGSGSVAHTFNDYIFENLISTDQVTVPQTAMIYLVLANDANVSMAQVIQVKQGVHVTQAMQFQGTGSYVWTPGANIVEVVTVTDHPSAIGYMRVQMTQALKVAQKQVLALLAAINETISITPLMEAYIGTFILNRLLVADQAGVSMKYAVSVAEATRIASLFERFIGAFATDGFVAGDDPSVRLKAITHVAEFLTLALDQRFVMAFRITAREDAILDDDAALHAIYRMNMTEIIDLEILLQAPNGAMTTWAINTRTGAITEYQNYNFNSFVQVGNRYLAASKDGLYELDGAQDDGSPVIADIIGAFLQPAGQHLAGLKGVYLGQTGQGYWLLKIDTGDGREYVYQRLSNPALMTTKFTIGKGINARYIGWELINVEGQDFDIDSIEFVPMLRTRRI